MKTGRRQILLANAILFFLLVLVFGAKLIFLHLLEGDREKIRIDLDLDNRNRIERAFQNFIDEPRQIAGVIHGVDSSMRFSTESERYAALHSALQDQQGDALWSAAIIDPQGTVRAYSGRLLFHDSSEGRTGTYFLQRDEVSTKICYAFDLPGAGDRRSSRVLLCATLENRFAINNRFFTSTGFVENLESSTGLDIVFLSGTEDSLRENPGYIRVPLHTGGSDKLGCLYFLRTDMGSHQDDVAHTFDILLSLLGFIFSALFSLFLYRTYSGLQSSYARIVLVIIHFVSLRFIFYYLGFGSATLPDALLDPKHFASAFAGGIVSSIGELGITLSILCLMTALLYRIVSRGTNLGLQKRAGTGLIFLLFIFIPFLMRGFCAAVKSFVFDSTLNYDSLASLNAMPYLIAMYLSVAVFSIACALLFATIFFIIRSIIGSYKKQTPILWRLIVAACLSLAIFFLVTIDTLAPSSIYAVFLLIMIVALLLDKGRIHPPSTRKMVVYGSIAGACVSFVLITDFNQSKRTSEIEILANQYIQPTDEWSKIQVEQTLQQCAGEYEADVRDGLLLSQRTSFKFWINSQLSKTPNNSAVLFVTKPDSVLSQFSVGVPKSVIRFIMERPVQNAPSTDVTTFSMNESGTTRTFYSGTAFLLHGVNIVVIMERFDPFTTARYKMDLLRNSFQSQSISPEDEYIISRFENGRITQATNNAVPRNFMLPEPVIASLRGGATGIWNVLPVAHSFRKTYFRKCAPPLEDRVIAISIGTAPVTVILYRFLRMLFVFILTGGAISLFVRIFTPRPWRLLPRSFTRTLQISFFLVATVPVFMFWMSGRQYLSDNLRREMRLTLDERLLKIVDNMKQMFNDASLASHTAQFSDELCGEIERRTGSDINIYLGTEIIASTKPELYQSGLLNSRLNPEAYARIFFEEQDFTVRNETIGAFSYFVGYKAIRDGNGNCLAIISTPTLFHQMREEESYAYAAAAIVSWTSLILLVVIAASSVLARQISKPLRALQNATREVSGGDLNLRVNVRGSQEIDELVDSFNSMTEQLREHRKSLAAAERELAWKEMAKQVAHEIRNPLTPMTLAAQHLKQAYKDGVQNIGELIIKVTDVILDQTARLTRISEEFSRFARMPERAPAPVDVALLLQEVAALFRHHARISFHIEMEEPLPRILADREELSRACINIFRNAVQAIGNRGSITLTANGTEAGIVIVIRDTGAGIPEDLLPKIFEPNFSTKTEGMGLGLAITKKIIDDLGGNIEIQSVQGAGTSVTMTLPVYHEDAMK